MDVSNQTVQQLSNDLVVLSARLVREVRRNTADLPAASTRLMSLLDELGPSTVGALAQADRCSQPTMTGIVNGLVDKGWVQRDPHPEDARASLVSMTAEGRKKLAAVRSATPPSWPSGSRLPAIRPKSSPPPCRCSPTCSAVTDDCQPPEQATREEGTEC